MRMRRTNWSMDATPIIDVVFLLIIFFLLVCQFIAAENFEAMVPEGIVSAQERREGQETEVTVSVIYRDGEVCYAVGAETLEGCPSELVSDVLRRTVDDRLAGKPGQQKIVCLRADRQTEFGYVQQALKAIAQSGAEQIRWAVRGDGKQERSGLQ